MYYLYSLNRREDEFSTLLDYNNFLEQRETIIANLVTGTDVAATEAQLSSYAAEHAASIKRNKHLESEESASFAHSLTLEQEAARLRREAARQEMDAERRAKAAGREDLITRLAAGTKADAEAIAREARREGVLKKSSARRSEEERIKRRQAALLGAESGALATPVSGVESNGGAGGGDLIKGLKKISVPEPEKPYDPFDGCAGLLRRDYFTLKEEYPSPYLDSVRNNTQMLAGGYDLREYYSRTLVEAFGGLGCFISEEMGNKDKSGQGQTVVTEG